jgi:subtilisin-like proprotein convertase family protein
LFGAACLALGVLSARAQNVSGLALNLDGATGHARMASGVWFSNQFTVESWVYVRSNASWARLIDFGNGPAGNNIVCALGNGVMGRPVFDIYNGSVSGGQITAPSAIPTNTWTHLAFTFDGTNGRILVNGIEVTNLAMTVPPNVTRTNNFIGRSNWPADALANAIIDEFRIWSVARSAGEIQSTTNRLLTGKETGLLSWLRFEDGTGTNLVDATLRGNGATTVSNVSFTNLTATVLPPPPSLGPFNPVLSFDGIDDYAVASRPVSNDFTIEFWFNSTQVAGSDGSWWDGMGLVDGEVSGTLNDFGVSLGNGRILFGIGNPNITIQSGFVADGSWHHVAATRTRSSGDIKLFIDGAQAAGGTANTNELSAPAQVRFGSIQTGFNFYRGLLDEVRIWNTPLTADQIQSNMIQRRGGNEPGLAACWRFDEGSGNRVADLTGRTNHAVLTNGVSWSASGALALAPVKTALALNGVNGAVDLGTNGPVLGASFTEEAWIFMPTNMDSGFRGLLGYSPGGNSQRAPSLWVTSQTALHGGFGNGALWLNWTTPTNVLTLGAWNHVAAAYNGAAYLVYVNGQLVLSTNLVGTPVATPVRYIGRADNFFPGAMDEVRLWNTARSQGQIQSNLLQRLAGTETNLAGYWRMDEGAGTSAADQSGRGLAGILSTGATWTAQAAPLFAPAPPAPIGSALWLDGTNDFVRVDRPFIPTNGDFTIECWVNAPVTNGGVRHIVSQGQSNQAPRFYLGIDSNGNFRAGDNWIATGVPMPVSSWHHVALTKNGTTNAFLYIDGVLKAAKNSGFSNAYSASFTDIGQQFENSGEFWLGGIDELRVWNVARTTSQIQSNMATLLTGQEPGLVAYFRMDDGGATMADLTGRGGPGRLTNGAVRVASTAPLNSGSIFGRVTDPTNGLAGVTLSAQPAPRTNSSAVPITDFSTNNSDLFVPFSIATTNVRVAVNIAHARVGDLALSLVAPDGTVVRLRTTNSDVSVNLVTSYPDLTAPTDSLNAFNGKVTAGTWRLVISDRRAANTGTLNSWSLSFGPAGVTNEAGGFYAFTGLGAGAFTVTPSRTDSGFTPASSLVAAGSGGVNFEITTLTQHLQVALNGLGTNVLINFAGPAGFTTNLLTDINGVLDVALPLGSYVLTPGVPGLPGLVFSPPSLTNSGNGTVNFSVVSGSLSGRVTAGSVGLSNILVNVTGSGTNVTLPTDANGNYFFGVMKPGGYVVRVVTPGLVFVPSSLSVLAGSTNVNFSLVNGTVAGRVTGGGSGVSGVTVQLLHVALSNNVPTPIPDSGSVTSSIVVPYAGTIGLARVAVDISHSFRGDLALTLISPLGTQVRLKVSDVNDDVYDVYTSFPDVDAPVDSLALLNGQGMAGTWRLKIDDQFAADIGLLSSWTLMLGVAPTNTDAGGYYAFSGLPYDSYFVQPSRMETTFSPTTRTVPLGTTNADFVVNTTFLRGRVTAGGLPFAGVPVILSGLASATNLTDANGDYDFTGLVPGSYTLTPTLAGHGFAPGAMTTNGGASNLNFSAASYPISGRVRDVNTNGVPGVTLTTSGRSTVTDSDGYYSLTNLAPAAYTVTPSALATLFSPTNRGLTITASASNGVDFMVLQSPPAITAISNRVIRRFEGTGPIRFDISDRETRASALRVSASSSDSAVFDVDDIALSGVGSDWTIAVTNRSGQPGTATLTVSVTDGTAVTMMSFLVRVDSVPLAGTGAALQFNGTNSRVFVATNVIGNKGDFTVEAWVNVPWSATNNLVPRTFVAQASAPVPGSSIAFNGSSQYISITNFGAIAPTNEVTVEFWANANGNFDQSAFMLNPDQGTNRFQAHINFSGGVTYWDFGNISTAGRISVASPVNSVSNWVHYALVASQSGNTMKIYTNGVLQATRTGMTPFVRGNYELRLGGNAFFFNGRLDDFRIWNVARSAQQIQSGYNLALSGSEPNLLLYYRLDATNGTVAVNTATATGPAYNGTLVNGPAWQPAPAPTTNGFYFGYDAQGRIRAGGGWTNTGVAFPFGGWHHLAVAKDNSNTFLYVDGVLAAARGGPLPMPTQFNTFDIGSQGAAEYWLGGIEDVRVWKATRSQGDFTEGMHRRLIGIEDGLTGLWHFDEAANFVARDSSSRSNRAAVVSADWIQSGVVFDHYTVQEEAIFTDYLPAFDGDGDPMTFRLVNPPVKGTFTLLDTNTGLFRYTAFTNVNGADSFSFQVNDGSEDSDIVFVTVNILADTNPPVITTFGNLVMAEDTALGPLAFTVGDLEAAAGTLVLSAFSSDETLVPAGNIIFGGSASNRAVTIFPLTNAFGSNILITLVVSDGQLFGTNQFSLTISNVNDTPTITALTNQLVARAQPTPPQSFTLGDVDNPVSTLIVTGTSGNQSLIPDGGINIAGSGATRTVSVTPLTNISGSAVITLTVNDGGGGITSTNFVVTVNDPPTISSISPQTGFRNTRTSPVAFTIGDTLGATETTASNLTVVASSSDQAIVPDANISVTGSGANRTVTATPAPGKYGVVMITLTVSDGLNTTTTSFQLEILSGPLYAIEDLGSRLTYPVGLNDSSTVIGWGFEGDNGYECSIYQNGTRLSVPMPGGYTDLYAINNNGLAGGSAVLTNQGSPRAVTYFNGAYTDLTTAALGATVIKDLNDVGGILFGGKYINGTNPVVTFSGGFFGYGLNNAGDIAGRVGSDAVVRYASGQQVNLGKFGTAYADALAINKQNQVLCQAESVAFLVNLASGVTNRINGSNVGPVFLSGDGGGALNDAGQVVGRLVSPQSAFLWSDGLIYTLYNQLLNNAGWLSLRDATAINNRGEIIGSGTRTDGSTHGFLLRPQWIIGQPITPPLAAFRPPGVTNGTFFPPSVEVLSGGSQDTAQNSFIWSSIENKLYPVRPVTARISWFTTSDLTDQSNRPPVTMVGSAVWPDQPQQHIVGAPVQLNPVDATSPQRFFSLAYPSDGNGVTVEANSKTFNTDRAGYAVLRYLRAGSQQPNPAAHANYFQVVRSYQWDDPAVLRVGPDMPVGQRVIEPTDAWVYWRANYQILRAKPDGLESEVVADVSRLANGLAVDSSRGLLFYTDNTVLKRSRLDGADSTAILTNATGAGAGFDLGVDARTGKIYYTPLDSLGLFSSIFRCNLDGTGVETVLNVGSQGPFGIGYSFALDPVGRKLYWAEAEGIRSANLDGTGVQTVLPAGGAEFKSLAVDGVRSNLFWFDQAQSRVLTVRTDGSDLRTNFTAPDGIFIGRVSVDTASGQIYFGPTYTNGWRSDADGSHLEFVEWLGNFPLEVAFHGTGPGASSQKSGWVVHEHSYYDGTGIDRAYDRATQTGPIIPVNVSSQADKDLAVVFYHPNAIGVDWADSPVRYDVHWPTNPPQIVVASGLGSGPLGPVLYPQKRIYNQPDSTLPGFNPNEEHALFAPGTTGEALFALRNDLNSVRNFSQPYALLKYRDPDDGQWAMKVYQVVVTNADYPEFKFDGLAGNEIQPPYPLSLLPLCANSTPVSGPYWKDKNNKIYARAAERPADPQAQVVVRYHYPLQIGFWYDLNNNGANDEPVGSCVAWLDRQTGTPIDTTYRIHWPADLPTLQLGETLTTAKFGLPGIRNMASAEIIFDSLNPDGTLPLESRVRLFDPYSPRVLKFSEYSSPGGAYRLVDGTQLPAGYVLPAAIKRSSDAGKDSFPDLPFHLRTRLKFDPINKWLSWEGLDVNTGVGAPLVLINVMSAQERDRIKELSTDGNFQKIIDALYDLTRNPHRLDQNRDGVPDRELLIGFTYQYVVRVTNSVSPLSLVTNIMSSVPTNANMVVLATNIAGERFTGVPMALTAGLPFAPPQPAPGRALEFNGTDTYVPLTRPVSNDFTIEFWLKSPQLTGGTNDYWDGNGLVTSYQYNNVGHFGVTLGDGRILFGTGGNDSFSDRVLRSGRLTPGRWYHVAATRQKSDGLMVLYMDGVEVARTNGTTEVLDGFSNLELGRVLRSGTNNYFHGLMDELRIWSTVRGTNELYADKSRRLAGTEEGLAGYWRFDDYTYVRDSSVGGRRLRENDDQRWDGCCASIPGMNFVTVNDLDTGTPDRYLTIAENNDPNLVGLPVSLHIIRFGGGPVLGDLRVIYPDNVFDERLTLRHSGDFGGAPENLTFEWWTHPDSATFDFRDVPVVDANGNVTDARGWVLYKPATAGRNFVTIGEGGESSLFTLSDNWFLCRYRGYNVNGSTNWTRWIGDPASQSVPQAMLAPGWIKRVLEGINPFDQRIKDFHQSPIATYSSMLIQAGERYEGDVPLNPDASSVNSVGLIQLYTTVLNRGRSLSIDGTPAVDSDPANNALLLAASRIADLYMLIGNEAVADAVDPTVEITVFSPEFSPEFSSRSSSLFAFQNQLDSLLEEELVIYRGRDDARAGVQATPVYNRLIWNFTGGDGEVAYAHTYNLSDINFDGALNEFDARILFPQGHGDAWGHYLTAAKTYYDLLRHPHFTWIPRSEHVLVAGTSVEVDYLDERKFARIASARARAGREIVDLTYRQKYVEDPAGQYQGYKDTDASRAWGVTEWARRAGQGAWFDWLTANTVLPAKDPNTNHTGIQKIDRTTVTELGEIAAQHQAVQALLDKADAGLNPIGVAKGAVPFDIDPSAVAAGFSQFDQVYDHAVTALRNTQRLWNDVNSLSRSLRRRQDATEEFTRNSNDQERDFKNRLIEIFGYPHAGDIGPGATYPSGYDGPDLYHYMYVGATEIGQATAPAPGSFTGYFTTLATNLGHFFPADLPGATNGSLTGSNILAVNYPLSAGDFGFVAPASYGQRRAPGEIQMALSDLVQAQARLKQSLVAYDNLVKDVRDSLDLLQAQYALNEANVSILNWQRNSIGTMNGVILGLRATQLTLRRIAGLINATTELTTESLPKVIGLATDAMGPVRGTLKGVSIGLTEGLEIAADVAEGAEAGMEIGKEDIELQTGIQLQVASQNFEVQQKVKELEALMRQEPALRIEAYTQGEIVRQTAGRYLAALAAGQRLLQERFVFRTYMAADVQEARYQDMAFRIFRNDALQKYRAQFDLSARYVYLAANAYDYEVNLLGSDPQAGQEFLTDIVRQRHIGVLTDGEPVVGQPGLADSLARLKANWDVLRTQYGVNNPQLQDARFSLRRELFRIKFDESGTPEALAANALSDSVWKAELQKSVVPDLWKVPEFRRFCRPFAPELAGPQPGIIIRFPTTITYGLNFFGWPLSGGDSSYDPTLFSTRIGSAGVWFDLPNPGVISATPRVYLVPVGMDVMRSPTGDTLATREWRILDQVIPQPFPIGANTINQESWIPMNDSLGGNFVQIRRYSSFAALMDGGYNPDDLSNDTRLIGRSAWNTEWLLIIPGGTLLADPNSGLEAFIDGVKDIKFYFQTYSYSGN